MCCACIGCCCSNSIHSPGNQYRKAKQPQTPGKQSCLRGCPQREQSGRASRAPRMVPDIFRTVQTAASGWGSPVAVRGSVVCPPHCRRNFLCPTPQELSTEKVHRSSFSQEQRQTKTNVPNPAQWLKFHCPYAAIHARPSSEAEDIRRSLCRKCGRVYLRILRKNQGD